MSDHIVKIIPDNTDITFEKTVVSKIIDLIKAYTAADAVEFTEYDNISFIDCGENLQEICCPVCGSELDFQWWGEALSEVEEIGFSDLIITLPCCKSECSLNALDYRMPCGFSKGEIDIINPEKNISDELIKEISSLCGFDVRMIESHY